MKEIQCLVITLPPHLVDLPIRIIRGSSYKELLCSVQPVEKRIEYSEAGDIKYVLVWRQNDYLKLTLDEILWIKAEGSYTRLFLTGNRNMMVSFHLAVVE